MLLAEICTLMHKLCSAVIAFPPNVAFYVNITLDHHKHISISQDIKVINL